MRPIIDCATCPASVKVKINLKNYAAAARATITGKYGDDKLDLGTKTVGRDGIVSFDDTLRDRQAAAVVAGGPAASTTSASPSASAARRSPATRCTAGSARSRSPTGACCSTAST